MNGKESGEVYGRDNVHEGAMKELVCEQIMELALSNRE
jgi:hypothetical protein